MSSKFNALTAINKYIQVRTPNYPLSSSEMQGSCRWIFTVTCFVNSKCISPCWFAFGATTVLEFLQILSITTSSTNYTSVHSWYCTYKVFRPNLVTYLIQTSLFKWCVVRCRSKNRHRKGIIHLVEIGLCAHNLLTILIQQSTYILIISKRKENPHLDNQQVTQKLWRNRLWPWFTFATHFILIMCLIS